jgi:putative transposase
LRLITMIDEFTRECRADPRGPALEQPSRDRNPRRVHAATRRAGTCSIRQRRGDDRAARAQLASEPRSPWENGYCESFNGKLRDECLNEEIFYSLKEAQVIVEMWRKHYNTVRPHSALGYRAAAPLNWAAAA